MNLAGVAVGAAAAETVANAVAAAAGLGGTLGSNPDYVYDEDLSTTNVLNKTKIANFLEKVRNSHTALVRHHRFVVNK